MKTIWPIVDVVCKSFRPVGWSGIGRVVIYNDDDTSTTFEGNAIHHWDATGKYELLIGQDGTHED